MKLMTKEIEKVMPALYDTDGVPADEKSVPLKMFTPDSSFRWYMLEYDRDERVFFAFVTSHLCPDGELGYVSLDELEELRGPMGLPVERDLHWNPDTLLGAVKKGDVA